MIIKPSALIRKNYNEVVSLCKESGEPVYLTKNGEGDLVVMDIASFERLEKMYSLREKLFAIEDDRLQGKTGYSIDEASEKISKAIDERDLLMKFKVEMEVARRCKLAGLPTYTSDDMLNLAEEIMSE
jgi:prevent-host-death family protein